MTDKEKLNSILRLRLFFSTEKELSDFIGYNLKGNHFSRFKTFQCDAYFCKFSELYHSYTQSNESLEWLLYQYEATSNFFKKYIEKTSHEANKKFISLLLHYLYVGEFGAPAPSRKVQQLCERYDACNREGEMNVGILLLITYGLLPTFKNKTAQDISDIADDFQEAYKILQKTAHQYRSGATTIYREMLCLREMRQMVEEERAGDKYLNRILLIFITNDVLNHIFALLNPVRVRQYSLAFVSMDMGLARFWRCEEDADNVVWEFCPLGNVDGYYLYRKEIDYQNRKIRYIRYQLLFKDLGYKDFCYTVIMHPAFNYHNMLKLEQPEHALTYDYTDLEYEDDRYSVRELAFSMMSPGGEKPMTLKPIRKDDVLRYYRNYIDHEGTAKDFVDIDCLPEYDIRVEEMEVAVTDQAILFKDGPGIYRLDKFDEDGEETIAGIRTLTHKDNFIYAELNDPSGEERHFLCLDSINQNLDLDELVDKPYFRKITSLDELFDE